MSEKNTYEQGMWAETLAAMYLCLKGYKVLERRYKTKVGEVDIIARKGKTVVAVEVKYRPSVDEALSVISAQARSRIASALSHYIARNPVYARHDLRFDVIAVSGGFSIHHLDNAWMEGA